MRSSKKRSRSSQNRPRTLGNIINRVFDSSGPEGKVRGTPQQIIEKYQMLARDAHLSDDRVASENFLQHAEHYTRLLAEAQREQAAEQEARQQQYQSQNGNGGNREGGGREWRDRDDRRDRENRAPGSEDQPMVVEVIDLEAAPDDSGLVDTPETRRRDNRPDEAGRDRPGGSSGGSREGGPRDRRDRDFRRDRAERRPDPAAPAAEAPAAEPELPAFITGPAGGGQPETPPAPDTPDPAAKPRRSRKPKEDGGAKDGKKEAAE